MPKEKNIYGRISQKIDTEANWLKAVNFIPNKGEIIIYEKDASHTYDRIKIGDGVSNVNDLPFSNEFIKTINGKEPDENGNIKIRTPYEVVLSYYEGLVTAFNRIPQQIIEAERSADKEVIYKLYIPIVTEDSETGPDIYATVVELKNANENYNSYTGYQIVVKFGEKYPPIIIDGSTNSFYIDETWVAPTTPSDIPDTTSARQYLVTNSSGEKVWTNLPVTETIRIDLTDATRIMPDVIQNYSALTPAEIIQKGRYLSAYNLVFYREIRDHVGNQMGVVVDLIKDRGYKAFKNENGDYCLRVYFDNYAPIIIDATKENPIYLDPEYVVPEPIIPETTEPHQYLTTNENGEKVWEEKLAYYTWEEREVVPTQTIPENHNFMLPALFEIEDGTQCHIIYEGQNYTGICSNTKNGMYFNINMTEGEGFPVSKLWISIPPFTLSGPLAGFSGTIQVFANVKVPKPIKQEFLGVPIAAGEGYNSLVAGNIALAKAPGQNSIALVVGEASGAGSVAINSGTVTDTGTGSFAQGSSTASGIYATALGIGTVAAGRAQLTHGENNIEDTENKYLHIVGNGTSGYDENNKYFKTHSNAYTLDRNGNAWFQGTIKIGGTGQDDEVAIEVATKPDVATLQSAIDTLNGTGEGSIRDTVADAVATIVANAPEDFDTLKEVADWISNDTLGTADLLQRMTTAEEKIVELDVQADWNQADETAKDFIKNKPNENDALALLAETGFIDPATAADGSVFTDSKGTIYSL